MQRTFAAILIALWLLLILEGPAHAEKMVVITEASDFFHQAIITFDSFTPATISQPKFITGLSVGDERFFNIDFRPANGQLYGLTSFNRLYRIDVATGVATLIPTQLPAVDFSQANGIDFNPVSDELRIVNRLGQNFRVNVDTGVVIQENSLGFAPGDPTERIREPQVTSIAYTNSLAGAASTTLYGVETNFNIVVTMSPEEQGLLHTVGPLAVDPLNGSFFGFDISGFSGIGYATFVVINRVPDVLNNFYTIDLSTGKATLLRTIGDGSFAVLDLAVATARVGDLCLQDDSTGNLLQINTTTGEYQFANCGKLAVGGSGLITRRGGVLNLQHNAMDRRVLAKIDTATNRATASIQLLSTGQMFSISDRNITNNTCACK